MNQANNQKLDSNKTESGVDYQHWQNLINSTTRVEYFASWLAILSESIGGVEKSFVLVQEEGNLIPSGYWPASENVLDNESYLLAKDAVLESKALIESVGGSDDFLLSYPLAIDESQLVVVVMRVNQRNQVELSDALKKLQLSSAWLELIFRREESQQDQELVEQAISTLGLMSSLSGSKNAHSTAMELVSVLAHDLACEKVIYGVYKKNDVELIALSNNGQFGKKMNVMNSISDLMLEAIDQQRSLRVEKKEVNESKDLSDQNSEIDLKHKHYLKNNNAVALMTVPAFSQQGECLGALTLERSHGEPFNKEEYDLVATISNIAANIINVKCQNERSIFSIVKNRIVKFWRSTVSNTFPLRNAILSLLVLGLFVSLMVKGDFEIKANTVLEGFIERSVVAPFDGYIQLSEKRVGDAVNKGEVLGRMDASDLQLELTELLSQQSQILSQVRESQAAGDRARAKIFQSQLEQILSQINLLNLRIERTNLIAPYDGYIVRGDLSRQLGAAINRGDIMFVVAPLNKYRVVMQVDEKDIAFVESGNQARLILTALANERINLTIDEITPIATAAAGRNYFRVEAELEDDSQRLRPGMEGVVRIEAGEKTLLWIWVRDFVDWLRIFVWKWMP